MSSDPVLVGIDSEDRPPLVHCKHCNYRELGMPLWPDPSGCHDFGAVLPQASLSVNPGANGRKEDGKKDRRMYVCRIMLRILRNVEYQSSYSVGGPGHCRVRLESGSWPLNSPTDSAERLRSLSLSLPSLSLPHFFHFHSTHPAASSLAFFPLPGQSL